MRRGIRKKRGVIRVYCCCSDEHRERVDATGGDFFSLSWWNSAVAEYLAILAMCLIFCHF